MSWATYILLPDRVSLAGLRCLAGIRHDFVSRIRATTKVSSEPISAGASLTSADISQDPVSFALLGAARAGKLLVVVPVVTGDYGYAVATSAWEEGVTDFLVWDTLRTGHFAVARSLMRHNSLEIKLDGAPVYCRPVQVDRALNLRPPSRTSVRAMVRAVIDDFVSRGQRPSRKRLVETLRENSALCGVSNRELMATINHLKPAEWTQPGRPPVSK